MTRTLTQLARAIALCTATLAVATGAQAAGDKAAYDQSKTTAKSAYDMAKKQCDAMNGNAKDICVAEAKASRVKTDEEAKAMYKGTPKAREHARHEIAEADYTVAKERCDDKTGNDKDVCVKEAKAAMVTGKADAKASLKVNDARTDAMQDKRKANYKVATEKCDAMAGDAKSACMAAAKSQYGM